MVGDGLALTTMLGKLRPSAPPPAVGTSSNLLTTKYSGGAPKTPASSHTSARDAHDADNMSPHVGLRDPGRAAEWAAYDSPEARDLRRATPTAAPRIATPTEVWAAECAARIAASSSGGGGSGGPASTATASASPSGSSRRNRRRRRPAQPDDSVLESKEGESEDTPEEPTERAEPEEPEPDLDPWDPRVIFREPWRRFGAFYLPRRRGLSSAWTQGFRVSGWTGPGERIKGSIFDRAVFRLEGTVGNAVLWRGAELLGITEFWNMDMDDLVWCEDHTHEATAEACAELAPDTESDDSDMDDCFADMALGDDVHDTCESAWGDDDGGC